MSQTLCYEDTPYFYTRNAQIGIIGILNQYGGSEVQYTYDAWGKLLSTTGNMGNTVGRDNPLRYKGYYYDTENGLYYLQSRYYDPAIGRFINADTVLNSTGETNGFSLYTYGAKNPVLNEDSSGNIPVETILDVAAIGSSAYDMVTKPCWSNLGYLAWDVTAAAVPYAPGSYVAKSVKYTKKVSKAAKVAKAAKAKRTAKKLRVSKAAPKVVKATGRLSKRDTLLKSVSNKNLKNAIKEMYRVGASVGDGSLAAAIRVEVRYGTLIGGKSHLQKGRERIRQLERLMGSGKLNKNDWKVANQLTVELKRALNGK